MERDSAVDAGLREVARENDGGASESIRRTLIAEVRSIRSARRRRAAAIGLLAASVGVAAVGWRTNQKPATEPARIDVQLAPAPDEVATDFLPLLYSNVPTSGRRVVRVEVPRHALASFGLASFDLDSRSTASPMVVADVVVGDDGLARAVRFVTSKPQENVR